MRASPRLAILLASALVVPGCLEADMSTELRGDGSGSVKMGVKYTDKFLEICRKLEKIDPTQDTVKKSRTKPFERPDEAALAAMEKAGLKLTEFEAVADDKQVSAKVRVEFRNLASLAAMDRLKPKKGEAFSVGGTTLTKDDKGVYTLTITPDDKKGGGGEAEAGETIDFGGKKEPGAEGGEKADPEARAKKTAAVMELMSAMMEEAMNLKMKSSITVPGEIVDFEPNVAAKKDGGTVTWEFTLQSIMELQASGGQDSVSKAMKVRFRMAEGKSLPDSCLTPAAPAPAAPAPAPAPEKPAEPK
jgi:hypothetical protein